MAESPSDVVYRELVSLLESDDTRLGDVYRLTTKGMSPEQIADDLGVSTPGFVWNYRSTMRALLEGATPSGSALASRIASAVRGFIKRHTLSDGAKTYIDTLSAELAAKGPREDAPSADTVVPPTESLRDQVESELRRRARELVARITKEAEVEPDDYLRVAIGPSAVDQLWALTSRQSTSRTTRELAALDRLDLSIEQATVDWAADLPFLAEMVTAAQARLDYWRST